MNWNDGCSEGSPPQPSELRSVMASHAVPSQGHRHESEEKPGWPHTLLSCVHAVLENLTCLRVSGRSVALPDAVSMLLTLVVRQSDPPLQECSVFLRAQGLFLVLRVKL